MIWGAVALCTAAEDVLELSSLGSVRGLVRHHSRVWCQFIVLMCVALGDEKIAEQNCD